MILSRSMSGKIRINIYEGGEGAHRSLKIFQELNRNCAYKIAKFNHFAKSWTGFSADLVKNLRIIDNYIGLRGSWAIEFFSISLNFPLASFFFPQNSRIKDRSLGPYLKNPRLLVELVPGMSPSRTTLKLISVF